MAQLVLVEDDERMGALLKRFLESQGYQVVWAKDGPAGVTAIREHRPDGVILDLMLPGFDGLEAAKRVRPDFTNPILMLTAVDDDISEISALDLGIDDYLTKPFRSRVLAARIRALLRRGGTADTETVNENVVGVFRFVPGQRTAWLDDQQLNLTESEYELLWLLAQRPGQTIARDEIYGALKGGGYQEFDRAIDMRISSLRKKLNDPPPYRFIKTVRGKGYLFSAAAHD